MLSTEFLLFLITVIFSIYVIMQYYKDEVRNNQMFSHMGYNPIEKNDMMYRRRSHQSSESDYDDQTSQQKQPTNQTATYQQSREGNGYNRQPQRLNVRVNNANNGGPRVIDPLRKFDYDVMYDEFTPPFRRSYYDEDAILMPGLGHGGLYTRGPPGRFRKIGTLIAQGVSHNDKYKFMNILGREKYPGRDYEYYCTSVDHESKLKIYIETKGKEIRDGDSVQIPELAGYNYLFKEDKDLTPLYDPYVV